MSNGTEPTNAPRGPDEQEELRAELDLANRKLAEAHKMASLGRMSAGIVHEINTPIGSIFSNNEVVMRSLEKIKAMLAAAAEAGEPPPKKAMEMLDVIVGLTAIDKLACERIASVIRSLKTFARVSEHDLRKIDVNELIRHTLKLSSAVFRRRIVFDTDLGELPEVECFPALLGQVLLNLVVNAAQAIPDEGRVLVRTRTEDSHVHIEVQDTGRGIRPEDHARIFQAGFTTKPIGEGTGIGLAISREIIVDTHHGEIDFESEPGKGTTFHVRIPIEQSRI
jgi:two-component system NtrC family sensor kinase